MRCRKTKKGAVEVRDTAVSSKVGILFFFSFWYLLRERESERDRERRTNSSAPSSRQKCSGAPQMVCFGPTAALQASPTYAGRPELEAI